MGVYWIMRLCVGLVMAVWWQATARPDDPVSFRSQVAPLLLRHCVGCHGGEKADGGYRMDTYNRLMGEGDTGREIVAGDATESELFRRLATDNTEERMPLEAEPLDSEALEMMRAWIEQGAAYDGEDKDAPFASLRAAKSYESAPSSYAAATPITALVLTPDGQQVVAGGYHEVTVWSATTGELLRRIGNIGERVSALAWTPNGSKLLVGGGEPGEYGDCRVVDWAKGEVSETLSVSSEMVQSIALDPAGLRVAVARGDGVLAVHRLSDGEMEFRWPSFSDWVTAVAWSGDGKLVLSGGRDRAAKLFGLEAGELLISVSAHEDAISAVTFVDGERAMSCSMDGKAWLWRRSDGERIKDFRLAGGARQLCWIGEELYALGYDRQVRQVDPATGVELRRYGVNTGGGELLSLAVAADGSRLAIGGFDGRVFVLDVESGAPVVEFTAAPHDAP